MSTKDEAILSALRACGSDDKQLADAVLVLGIRVTEKGGAFFYNDKNSHDVPLDNIGAFKRTMQDEKPHLLPRAFESSLADRAFIDGSLAARGELIKQVGELEANRIAKTYGLTGLGDTRRARAAQTDDVKRDSGKNPWAFSPQNTDEGGRYTANALTRQAALVKANLTGAAEIAAAVGSKVGDTHAKRRATA
jgi:hypothetical protein